MTHERNKLTGAPLRASEKRKSGPNAKSFRSLAKAHAEEALGVLADLAKGAASESVRVSAANALLDRAYGKPTSGAAARAAAPGQAPLSWSGGEVEVEWLDGQRF